MDLSFLFIVFLFVLLGIFLFKVIHKVASFVVTMLLIGCIVFGFFVYLDYKNVEKAEFQTLFIFTSNGKITYAAETAGFDLNHTQELAKADRIRMEILLNSTNFEGMLGDSQKLVIVYEEAYKKDYNAIIDDFRIEPLGQINMGLKEGSIIMYPETTYFKFIKRLPKQMVPRFS